MTNSKQKSAVTKNTNTKKGVDIMTHKEALQKLMVEYNEYQEYRAKQKQSYNYASAIQLQQWASKLTKEELDLLTKSYLIQRKFQQRLSTYLSTERKLNNIYGKQYQTKVESNLEQDILNNLEQSEKEEK